MTNTISKKYRLTKNCFVGKAGDIIEVDWFAYDGASWVNKTQNTTGSPFIETDCIEEV